MKVTPFSDIYSSIHLISTSTCFVRETKYSCRKLDKKDRTKASKNTSYKAEITMAAKDGIPWQGERLAHKVLGKTFTCSHCWHIRVNIG